MAQQRAERSGRIVPSIAAVMPYTKMARAAARISISTQV